MCSWVNVRPNIKLARRHEALVCVPYLIVYRSHVKVLMISLVELQFILKSFWEIKLICRAIKRIINCVERRKQERHFALCNMPVAILMFRRQIMQIWYNKKQPFILTQMLSLYVISGNRSVSASLIRTLDPNNIKYVRLVTPTWRLN